MGWVPMCRVEEQLQQYKPKSFVCKEFIETLMQTGLLPFSILPQFVCVDFQELLKYLFKHNMIEHR